MTSGLGLDDGELRSVVTGWMLGNKAATDLIYDLANIAHLYDDLIDRDKEIEDWRVHDAFLAAMVRVPRNPVFRECAAELTTLIEASILNWRAANKLIADGNPAGAHTADVIRYSFAEIVIYVARLVGGHAHAAKIAANVWDLVRDDTFDEFLKEHRHEVSEG